ncbi:MAG TPA: peptidoglycan DD-metalloendopeptidase family protein, partial [bacterium]|nr:peptidoglycan DD-metalloendopeptidase family protein [bacterium]
MIKRFLLNFWVVCCVLLMNTSGVVQAQSISDLKQQQDDIQQRMDDLKGLIDQKMNEAVNLENQIAIFDAKIEQLQLQIQDTDLDITNKQNKIDTLSDEINRQQRVLDYQKNILDESLQMLYEQRDQDIVMIILSSENFSDFVKQITYVEAVKEQVRTTIVEVNKIKSNLESQRGELKNEMSELEDLKKRKEEEQAALQSQKDAKSLMLEQTKGEEEEFQRQLSEAAAEEQSVADEIDRLAEEARKKLEQQYPGLEGGDGFGYPLAGVNRISVIGGDYMDPYYGFGFPHTGVDLAAAQGTPVYAAADGVVIVAYDSGGGGLSYIAIQHANGLMTKYLHVSEIFVSTGQYVSRGEAVGLSGGSPGTHGAGYFTTGAHLHFEIDDTNGNSVNPHNFL